MIVAGIGCRKGTAAEDILAAIGLALRAAGLDGGRIDCIATAAEKGAEPGIAAAAASLSRPLVLIPSAELKAAGGAAPSRSERVVALFGVPSLAEAAALAAAGAGASILVPRRVSGGATCALAAGRQGP